MTMYIERFKAWQLVRLRGRGPYSGSAWRAAAHIYRDRAINCMEAMRSFQESIHVWEDAYTQLEEKHADEIRAAINDKLEEVAIELDKLSQGTYTTAQTPAGLVRAMKVK
jgi:hypothetical protein